MTAVDLNEAKLFRIVVAAIGFGVQGNNRLGFQDSYSGFERGDLVDNFEWHLFNVGHKAFGFGRAAKPRPGFRGMAKYLRRFDIIAGIIPKNHSVSVPYY